MESSEAMERLHSQRILVTGAASGIGQATALRLLNEGAAVMGSDIAADGLATTAARAAGAGTGGRFTTCEMNVADELSVIEGCAAPSTAWAAWTHWSTPPACCAPRTLTRPGPSSGIRSSRST
ncbi:hypothetical protein NIIDMKKI_04170 [Mycobacterium kansasii]|uniref:Short chain dehydrogenase family protein n=1 Tax=Mycobacterium kansasii TaxID=1768 RepID=A0A7G1I2C9_MYCKA|nr:hypothetical protein NIIDMKKI_04170 [Mycobacterium kansasii]